MADVCFFVESFFYFFLFNFFKVPHVNPRVSGLVTLSLAAASLDEASLDEVAHMSMSGFSFSYLTLSASRQAKGFGFRYS